MRILYVLGFLPTYVQREIDSLADAGHDIVVLLPSEEALNVTAALWKDITNHAERQTVTVHRIIPFQYLTSPLRLLLKPLLLSLEHLLHLYKSLKESEFRFFLTASDTLRSLGNEWIPDVVHTHFAKDQAHIARIMAGIMGVPYTVTTHATDIFVPQSTSRLKRVLRDAGAVITISNFNKIYMAEKEFASGNVEVIRLGIDPASLPERATDTTKQEGICVASGLVEKKGLDVLLKSAELLVDKFPELTFKVVGSDPGGILLNEFRIKAKNLPVHFLGILSSRETLKLVAEAPFFVLPCVRASNGDMDGIPVSVMEAMGIGVPVVSSRISGIPELIENEKSGFLAIPGSAESLAEAICRVLQSHEFSENIANNGREKLLLLHSPDSAAQELTKIFGRLQRESKGRKNELYSK